MEPADHALDAGRILDAGDVGEQRSQRSHARGVNAPLVHASRVVIAELLLDASVGPIRLRGQLFQKGLQLLPVGLASVRALRLQRCVPAGMGFAARQAPFANA